MNIQLLKRREKSISRLCIGIDGFLLIEKIGIRSFRFVSIVNVFFNSRKKQWNNVNYREKCREIASSVGIDKTDYKIGRKSQCSVSFTVLIIHDKFSCENDKISASYVSKTYEDFTHLFIITIIFIFRVVSGFHSYYQVCIQHK